jgi:cysteinyl-tRNA synthetase
MVRETLGEQIDIHSGGRDLIFPHHENEIAQSEAMTGQVPFARYWPHVGLVTTEGEKMAHSLENFTTIHDIVAKYDPMALRLFLLSTHYRAPLVFSEDGLIDKSRALDRLRGAAEGYNASASANADWPESYRADFTAALDDDFNSAGGLGILFDLAREVNRRRAAADADSVAGQALLVELATVLGLDLQARAAVVASPAEPYIDLLLDIRTKLREARQWALADQIRDGLKARGVLVEDQAGRSAWHWTRPGE